MKPGLPASRAILLKCILKTKLVQQSISIALCNELLSASLGKAQVAIQVPTLFRCPAKTRTAPVSGNVGIGETKAASGFRPVVDQGCCAPSSTKEEKNSWHSLRTKRYETQKDKYKHLGKLSKMSVDVWMSMWSLPGSLSLCLSQYIPPSLSRSPSLSLWMAVALASSSGQVHWRIVALL